MRDQIIRERQLRENLLKYLHNRLNRDPWLALGVDVIAAENEITRGDAFQALEWLWKQGFLKKASAMEFQLSQRGIDLVDSWILGEDAPHDAGRPVVKYEHHYHSQVGVVQTGVNNHAHVGRDPGDE